MERIFYFIATIFLLNLRLAWAFNTSFTPPTQCGPFTVTWNATADTQTGPPYKLIIIPVNGPSAPSPDSTGLGPQLSLPIVADIPDTAWDAATTSGTYTIEQLQLRSGEHFIIVMDDGFGLGTGGVSQIQTVENGDAGGSAPSCIPSDQANANVYFSLSTLQPQQCSSLTINVNSPKAVRGFVPGGTPFSLDLPASTTGNATVEWTVNVQAGTDFVLLYEGQNGDVASSGLLQSGPASGSSGGNCVANGPHTTGIPIPSFTGVPNPSSGSTSSGHGTATAAPSSSTTSTSSSRSNSIDMSILAGGAVVGFALLGRTDLSLLTIGLSFLARLQLVDAFSTSFTSATSCGAFTVNWNATAEQSIGPPFSLLIVPVNSPDAPADSTAARGPGSLSPPIRREIPESAWNAASRSGSYTIDQLPLQAGERFIVVMDDGFGYGTGGVSLIHRVETSGSSPTSCIPSSPANGNVYFAISSLNPAQCSPLTVLVNSPTEIRGFIPGGSPFSLDMPASTSGNVTVSWSVNIATGSSFVLFYRAQNGDLATSGLMESTAAGQFGDGCMSNAPHSTITGSPSQTNGAQVTTTNSGSKKISIPALVGGIIGGLGFLAAVALITFFVIIRRTDSMGRSRSVSTASGFKGRSYDFNTSNDRSSTGGTSAGYQNINKNKKEEGLEGRFGGKLFGGGRKKGGNASGSGGNMRTYTSSQRRAIYPGLSIASTQNRSIGLVTLDEPTHDVQMNPMPTMHQPSNPKTGHNDPNVRYPAVERIQNEAMSVSTDITGYTGRDSISISNAHQSSYSGQPLMTDSGTKNTSSVSDTPLNSNVRTNERPSTAPTSGGAPGFHLPSGWRRPSSDGDNIDNPNGEQPRNNMQLHEYPPDDKSAMRSRSSRRTVDRIDEGTDILTDDEYVPPVREDMFPPERHEDVTDTEALGSWDRRVVVDHPYATAQSPHVDGYDDAGRRIRGASVSHPYSDPLNSSSGSYPPTSFSSNRDRNDRRPNSRRRGVEESPTIIRHTDAGRFGLDDDDQSQESGRRRRVVELPPAYGEFSEGRGGRSRERA